MYVPDPYIEEPFRLCCQHLHPPHFLLLKHRILSKSEAGQFRPEQIFLPIAFSVSRTLLFLHPRRL